MSKKVYIVLGGDSDQLVIEMFKRHHYEIVDDMNDADIVVFGGGEDVTPSYYLHNKHAKTSSNVRRDAHEKEIYNRALELGIPMAGICRGGQFLHVMNGGKLYQHVDNHNGKPHMAIITGLNTEVEVTSVHHQMMKRSALDDSILLLEARVSENRETMSNMGSEPLLFREKISPNSEPDIEALFYVDSNSLCYQPHPEYTNKKNKDNETLFFYFINNYCLNLEVS